MLLRDPLRKRLLLIFCTNEGADGRSWYRGLGLWAGMVLLFLAGIQGQRGIPFFYCFEMLSAKTYNLEKMFIMTCKSMFPQLLRRMIPRFKILILRCLPFWGEENFHLIPLLLDLGVLPASRLARRAWSEQIWNTLKSSRFYRAFTIPFVLTIKKSPLSLSRELEREKKQCA